MTDNNNDAEHAAPFDTPPRRGKKGTVIEARYRRFPAITEESAGEKQQSK